MRVRVYTGPTLSHEAGRASLAARFFPPIKHGDILDALGEGVDCVAIIDGYYETVASVRHKEILQALEAGVRVLGSSSFGALRAAELNAYGMEGIGEIYRMYASGEIDGDDEVAVKHAQASEDYKMLNVPLVDLRYNLRQMVEAEAIEQATADVMIDCAKQMYFGERTFRRIFARAAERGASDEMIESCKNHFERNWHDLKRADAQLLLDTIAGRLDNRQSWPDISPPRLNRTIFLYRWNIEQASVETGLGPIREQEALAQLKFSTEQYPKAQQAANERCWLSDYAARRGLSPTNEELARCREQFLDREKINARSEENDWTQERKLTAYELDRLIETEAAAMKLAALENEQAETRSRLLLDYAQLCGLAARPSEIETEWQWFWLEARADDFDTDELLTTPIISLAVAPALQPEPVPELSDWCQQKEVAPTRLIERLSERVLLRKLASNYYIRPAVVYREQIVAQLKAQGGFRQALDDLVSIYERILQSDLSAGWHPQWKVFIQPDTRVIMEWFCKEQELHPKCARPYIQWKGFDELAEFLNIAQLNYISRQTS